MGVKTSYRRDPPLTYDANGCELPKKDGENPRRETPPPSGYIDVNPWEMDGIVSIHNIAYAEYIGNLGSLDAYIQVKTRSGLEITTELLRHQDVTAIKNKLHEASIPVYLHKSYDSKRPLLTPDRTVLHR
jgi:hypothetical protein